MIFSWKFVKNQKQNIVLLLLLLCRVSPLHRRIIPKPLECVAIPQRFKSLRQKGRKQHWFVRTGHHECNAETVRSIGSNCNCSCSSFPLQVSFVVSSEAGARKGLDGGGGGNDGGANLCCVVLCCVRFGSFQRYLTVRTFDRGHRIALAISAALPQPTVYRVFLKYSHLPTSCTAPRLPFHFRRSLKPNHEEDFCWRFGFGCFRFGGRFDERDFRFE